MGWTWISRQKNCGSEKRGRGEKHGAPAFVVLQHPVSVDLISRRDSFDEWAAKRQQNKEEAETLAPVRKSI